MHEHFADLYRDLPAIFVLDEDEVFPDMDVFEVPNIAYWFRDSAKPMPDDLVLRLGIESRPWFQVMASILRAYRDVE
ncbi:MAG: hypothetical protein ABI395_11130 [Sphingobium sp.]